VSSWLLAVAYRELLEPGGSQNAPLGRQAGAIGAALPSVVVIRLTLGLGAPPSLQLGPLEPGMGMPQAVVGEGTA
jgi:hypothetical protein